LKKKSKKVSFVEMIFVGVSLKNPHETSLIHLENEGFKRLVAYAKCDCFAYKNAKSSFFT